VKPSNSDVWRLAGSVFSAFDIPTSRLAHSTLSLATSLPRGGKADVRDCEDSFYLREEARKSWNHLVSDKFVYALNPVKVARDSIGHISKNYLEGRLWIEVHLTFVDQGHADHLLLLIERNMGRNRPRCAGKPDNKFLPMDRNTSMLVDVAEFVEPGEKMCRGVDSIVRLKRLEDANCGCGYSSSILLKLRSVPGGVVVKNRKLGVGRIPGNVLGFNKRPNGLVQGRTEPTWEGLRL
jgi:hypothetical protein